MLLLRKAQSDERSSSGALLLGAGGKVGYLCSEGEYAAGKTIGATARTNGGLNCYFALVKSLPT